MPLQGWIALGTLVLAAVLFVTRWLPLGITALAIPVVLVVTGTTTADEALSGFASHEVIAIAAIFVVGAALQESGVATLVAWGLQRLGGRRERLLVVLVMLSTATLSAFMNNAAAVALLLPAVVALCRRGLILPSRLLMPVAFGAVLGGTVTLIGTAPNLLVSHVAREARGEPIGVFEFAVVGVPIVLTGVLYMLTLGRRLLPDRTQEDRLREALLPEEVAQSYGLGQNLFQMRVVPQSGICGKTIAEAAIRTRYALSVVAVVRPARVGPKKWLEPRPDLVLLPEDRLYLEGDDVYAWQFAEGETLQFGLAGPQAIERMLGRGMTLAEVTVPPRSQILGRSLRDLDFRNEYGLSVLSLWRRGAAVRNDVSALPLEVGDAFLVSGSVGRVRALSRHPDYIVLTDQSTVEDVTRAPLAIALLLVAVVPPLVGWLELPVSALAAALLMVVTRCISTSALRRALDWKVLALIVGTLPLGVALARHGVAGAAAVGILDAVGGLGDAAVFAALFLVAAVTAVLSTNASAALIVAPVALSAANVSGVDLEAALLAVAYGCSCAFLLPFAQCNLLVMGPGAYRARDFFVVGLGLSLVMAVTAVAGLVLLY